ncbi:MAG: nucleoside-diphosphate sugar epimerase/dehydratase [Arenicellaceae bacterium]|nr:nucleoside-diphosphate sugar epimerase/dehydratase [Arenicellaceae bacterium]
MLDILLVPAAWLVGFWLRFNMAEVPAVFLAQAINVLPIVVVVQLCSYVWFGVHRGEWRFVSLPDLSLLIKSVLFGVLMIALALFFVVRLEQIPRSVFVLYGMMLAAAMASLRMGYRLLKDKHFASRTAGKKVLIVGAGAAGEQLVRDLRRNFPELYNVVAFVDDDESKVGSNIHRISIASCVDGLGALVERWSIDLVLIAIPSASDDQMQRIVDFCGQANVAYRTLPGVHELLTGKVSIADMRGVRIEDLLGRDPVTLDWQTISHNIESKIVLITGAGGSIGAELCRQIAAVGPKELVLYEQGEYNLYAIQEELEESFPELELRCILGDICDSILVTHVFKKYLPSAVFHAAAYKHVPLLEGQVREAVKNNILGTKNIVDAAINFKAESFLLISTDKAVNPSSLMGACKRTAEMYCQAVADKTKTRVLTVRFGNVLGSAGSVVPKFIQQIKKGGPITVTDPEMTRYFMTITEACQLILQASAIGEDGRIYVLDMGEPVKVAYLAEQLIKLHGKTPGVDIEITYTGLRPGEKLEEELFYADERLTGTDIEKLLLAASRNINEEEVLGVISKLLAQVCEADAVVESKDLCVVLNHLVPEYTS